MKNIISFTIPLSKNLTVSEANKTSEHWSKKSKRHRMQKFLVNAFMKKIDSKINLPCIIKLTRIAPRKLDYDNLLSSQKYFLDAICEQIIPGLAPGRADSDDRISVEYFQEKKGTKEYALQVSIISIHKT